ncbi:hypothetical protein DFH06DRAFT_1144020 [Mycena polygramma]|nr:hypothetical protein DFH06DRAFT_1144020 [Mycena polygramma]
MKWLWWVYDNTMPNKKMRLSTPADLKVLFAVGIVVHAITGHLAGDSAAPARPGHDELMNMRRSRPQGSGMGRINRKPDLDARSKNNCTKTSEGSARGAGRGALLSGSRRPRINRRTPPQADQSGYMKHNLAVCEGQVTRAQRRTEKGKVPSKYQGEGTARVRDSLRWRICAGLDHEVVLRKRTEQATSVHGREERRVSRHAVTQNTMPKSGTLTFPRAVEVEKTGRKFTEDVGVNS